MKDVGHDSRWFACCPFRNSRVTSWAKVSVYCTYQGHHASHDTTLERGEKPSDNRQTLFAFINCSYNFCESSPKRLLVGVPITHVFRQTVFRQK